MIPSLHNRGSSECVHGVHIQTGLFNDSSQMNTVNDTILHSGTTKDNFLS